MTKKLCDEILSLKGKNIGNKIGRNIDIIRLNEANVLLDKAMELISY